MLTALLTLILLTGNPETSEIQFALNQLQSAINRFEEAALLTSISTLDSLSALAPENGHLLVASGWARYELGTYYMVRKMGDKVTENYDTNMEFAEKLSSLPGYKVDGLVLKAAYTMNNLSVSGGASAPILSFKTHGFLDDAESIQPENPRLNLIRGMMYFFTPKMFGGSAEKALSYFEKSVAGFESAPNYDGTSYRLAYATSCAWAAQAAFKMEDGAKARTWCNRALSLQPEYGFVKHQLLPMVNDKFPE
ncbi:MAG: hypothetical protein J0L62_03605 [Bacteroidetes bacterium]|nr:hypothetical protein [Bacteroidota bacterium]